ncbi:hypothetical protein [Bacillus subtilis]|uniref:hypothetical protein n=1 Tax=Bacillus subtilis TaxID=1423 RepID=UPI001C22A428|nr:hypothetical protein [Bacillus subtilis]MBU8716581.1 hypothetical protein [Bacillus subtilis]
MELFRKIQREGRDEWMTMVIALNRGNSIIITADKRATETNYSGQLINVTSDNYKKVVIINGKYIVSFAGSTLIAEKAIELINENIGILDRTTDIDPLCIFKGAFRYGKACFEAVYPGVKPISIFILGYLKQNELKLFVLSSDDDYVGKEYKPGDIFIKMHSENPTEEENLNKDTLNFISDKLSKKPTKYKSNKNFAQLNSEAIKRINDPMIGKTTYSVVLSQTGIEEYEN